MSLAGSYAVVTSDDVTGHVTGSDAAVTSDEATGCVTTDSATCHVTSDDVTSCETLEGDDIKMSRTRDNETQTQFSESRISEFCGMCKNAAAICLPVVSSSCESLCTPCHMRSDKQCMWWNLSRCHDLIMKW